MTKFTNNTNVPIALALWLSTDLYDHVDDPMHISTTTLMKSVRQIILSRRVSGTSKEALEDISSKVASAMGTAYHTSIENAWLNNSKEGLKDLGYPEDVIRSIRINPTEEELNQYNKDGLEILPIYLEVRTEKKVGNWTVSGCFDMCMNGRVMDYKSTGTYSYTSKCNDKKYILQASIYRWLNPDKITNDSFSILFIFTNWNPLEARKPEYPQSKLLEYKLPLISYSDTEEYVNNKLKDLETFHNIAEPDLPECSQEDLWATGPTVYKYYKDPNKTSRSTKNFTTFFEANERFLKDGSIGLINEVKPKAKACNYCSAQLMCSQYSKLQSAGLI